MAAVVAGIFALLVPVVEHVLGSDGGTRSNPSSTSTPSPTGPGPVVPDDRNPTGRPDGSAAPVPGGGREPAIIEPVYLSSFTQPSNEISPDGFNGYSVARSVALKCNNPSAGESDRQVQYSLSGSAKSRLTGALGVMPIPSDLVATVQMKIFLDSDPVLSRSVSSIDEPIPFDLDLGDARSVTLQVQCDSPSDHRGVFVEAALS